MIIILQIVIVVHTAYKSFVCIIIFVILILSVPQKTNYFRDFILQFNIYILKPLMVKFKIVLSQYDYTRKYYRKVNDFIIT